MSVEEKEKKFKELLNSAVKKSGSLNKAAKAMGVDPAYLSRRLNPNSHNEFKKPPKPDTLRKIASICDADYITLMWLCDYFSDEEYSQLLDM